MRKVNKEWSYLVPFLIPLCNTSRRVWHDIMFDMFADVVDPIYKKQKCLLPSNLTGEQ